MARTAAAVLVLCCAALAAARTDRLDFGGRLTATTGYNPTEIFAEFDAAAFLNQSEALDGLWEESWPVPPGNHPFVHAFAAWNPQGHPAVDGFGGGYGTPHMDLHFFVITPEEREELAVCTSFPPCPEDEVSKHIYNFPPSSVVAPDFFIDDTFGGHGVPNHGMHWLWKGDLPLITPLGTGTEPVQGPPGWLPCLLQYTGQSPDQGCRLADWYPGLSPVYISLAGKTAAHEAMFSKDFIRRLKSGLISNPYKLSYPATEQHITDVSPPKYPSAIVAEYYPETDRVRFTLELVLYQEAKCPDKCEECDENFQCLKCNRARALWRNTCVRCNPLDMVKVNGKCIQKQSCLRMENGGFCESEDGACKLHSNGTPVPCEEDDGCEIIDDRCVACDLKYKSTCTQCEEGYAPNGRGRKCKPV